MRVARVISIAFLSLVMLVAIVGPLVSPHPYGEQRRDATNSPADRQYLLGTDDLGRDRFSRLLFATAVSATLPPAAALVSVVLALGFSLLAIAPFAPLRVGLSTLSTLTLSLPWIFPFLMLRSILPLNTQPLVSIVLTFAMIGVAGWAYPGRVLSSALQEISNADWLLQARASGITPWRTLIKQVLPHLTTLAAAQFKALIPAYILSEATLGLLGLGVAAPLPSWGNMLSELQHPDRIRAHPAVLAPLLLIMAVMISLEMLGRSEDRVA